jgi:hypothetical protein
MVAPKKKFGNDSTSRQLIAWQPVLSDAEGQLPENHVIFLLHTRKMANEQEFNVKLVELHPCLNNYKLSEYSGKDTTENAWENVAQVNKTGKYYICYSLFSFYSILLFISKTKMLT